MSGHLNGNGKNRAGDTPIAITSLGEVKTDAEVVARGRAAWDRIKQTQRRLFDDWLEVGQALLAGRAWAIDQSGTDPAKGSRLGRGFNTIFSQWLKDNGFDNGPEDRLHDAVRGALFAIMDNLDAVRAWRRDKLDDDKRRAWNSPPTVWDHFRSRPSPQPEAQPEPQPEPEPRPAVAATTATPTDTVSTTEPDAVGPLELARRLLDEDDDTDTDDDDETDYNTGYNDGYQSGYMIGRYEGALRHADGRKNIRDTIKELAERHDISVAYIEQTLADDCTYLEAWIAVELEHGTPDTKIATQVGLPVKLVREVIDREDLRRKADEARAAAGKPPASTVLSAQPWCKPGELEQRAALLLHAIEAAAWQGLGKWDDIHPTTLSDAACERGQDALSALGDAVPEVDDRCYLRRYAPTRSRGPDMA